MLFNLTDEEASVILDMRRKKAHDYNSREDAVFPGDCVHVDYDMEGDHCTIHEGFGVGDRCFACHGKDCRSFQLDDKREE